METSPDALAYDDPSVTIRAIKDITFGSVRSFLAVAPTHRNLKK